MVGCRIIEIFEASALTLGIFDTTGFSRVVFQFQPKEQAKELTDTTDFSRVVLQFLPDVPRTAKVETESPRD
jgi:hypothetical protein